MFIPAGIPNEKPQGWKSGLSEKIVGNIGAVAGFFKKRFLGVLNGRETIETKDPTPTPSHKENQFMQGVVDQAKNIVGGTVLGFAALGAQTGAMPQTEFPNNDGFIQAQEAKKSNTFGEIPVKKMAKKQTSVGIPIGLLKETTLKLRKAELGTPYETNQYDETGKFLQKIKKGTKILIDQSKPVTTLRNPKTGMNEVFVHIKGMIHVDRIGQVTLEPQAGYLATPWLNSAEQSKGHSRKENQERVNNEIPEPKNPISFAGYLGPDGREIPEPIMRAVTIKYVGNILAPRVKAKIVAVKNEIEENRELIKEEALLENKKLPETEGYKKQIESIKKKGELDTLESAITSFTVNGAAALTNPTVTSLLTSIKKTPEWQRIILQASSVHKQKLRGNHH